MNLFSVWTNLSMAVISKSSLNPKILNMFHWKHLYYSAPRKSSDLERDNISTTKTESNSLITDQRKEITCYQILLQKVYNWEFFLNAAKMLASSSKRGKVPHSIVLKIIIIINKTAQPFKNTSLSVRLVVKTDHSICLSKSGGPSENHILVLQALLL